MPSQQPFRAHGHGRWLERWRWVLVGVFGYGTAVHVVQLAVSGGRPYQGNPWWLVVFFVSLTVFDPAVAVGLARRRRWAVWSAAVLLGLDAAANGYAVYVVVPAAGLRLARVGQGIITVLVPGGAWLMRPVMPHPADCCSAALVTMGKRSEHASHRCW